MLFIIIILCKVRIFNFACITDKKASNTIKNANKHVES